MPIKTKDWEKGEHVGGYSVVIDVRTPAEWEVRSSYVHLCLGYRPIELWWYARRTCCRNEIRRELRVFSPPALPGQIDGVR